MKLTAIPSLLFLFQVAHVTAVSITLKTVAGFEIEIGGQKVFDVPPAATVQAVKELIFRDHSIPLEQMVLLYGGETLTPHMTLSTYGITPAKAVQFQRDAVAQAWPTTDKIPEVFYLHVLLDLRISKFLRQFSSPSAAPPVKMEAVGLSSKRSLPWLGWLNQK